MRSGDRLSSPARRLRIGALAAALVTSLAVATAAAPAPAASAGGGSPCGAVGWREVTVGGSSLGNISALAGGRGHGRVYVGSRRGTNNVMLASGAAVTTDWSAESRFTGVPVTDLLVTPGRETEVWASTFGLASPYDGPVFGKGPDGVFAEKGILRSWFMALAATDTDTYVATSKPGDRGVYRWDEATAQWRLAGGQTIETGAFHALEAGGDGRLWLGTDARGLWRSDDRGVTWQETSGDGTSPLSVWSVAVSPSDPERILMGLGPPDVAAPDAPADGGYRRGLAISPDGGDLWVFASERGLSESDIVTDIVFDPVETDVAFAAGYSRGLFSSRDGGASWFQYPVPDREQLHFEALLVLEVTESCRLLFAGGKNGLFVRDLEASHRAFYLPVLANR